MKLILAKIGTDKTVGLAQEELFRYLKKIDPTLFLDCRTYTEKDDTLKNILWIGLDGSVEASDRDEIRIDLANGAGIITGSNPRSVLIAAYRLLTELGCRFLFPGEHGDILPAKKFRPEDFTLSLQEKASYRHRSICIEGAVGYEHVREVIEWLPKVGMNGYFVQFQTPGTFFKRFYNDSYNPSLQFEPISDQEIDHIWSNLEEDVILRGLDYHAVGHGWTCDPFGIPGSGWNENVVATDEIRPYLAEVNGKREFWGGVPLNTNLCYSNPVVQKKMSDAVVEYCKEHPAVTHLHFWLADGSNNHCECEQCQKARPADFYVQILNQIDEKLTAAGISTKIVCLIYVDLFWEPQTERLKNPDRFTLMFAPITRNYSNTFIDLDLGQLPEPVPYVRNQLSLPKSLEENIAPLLRWEKDHHLTDAFDFDYHLMWAHYRDLGFYRIARILHDDMVSLDRFGLDGMVSCQINRCTFPNGLPMYAMAKALWNKNSTFEAVCADYFTSAYGELAGDAENYFATLSELIPLGYLMGDFPRDPQLQTKNCLRAKEFVADFRQHRLPKYPQGFLRDILEEHTRYCETYIDVFLFHLENTDPEARAEKRKKLYECAFAIEDKFPSQMDTWVYTNNWAGFGSI